MTRGNAVAAVIGVTVTALLVALMTLLIFCVGGCGGVAPTDAPDGDWLAPLDGGPTEAGPPVQSPAPGQLPLGYYQRQCQWDACGGPLPTEPNSLVEQQ